MAHVVPEDEEEQLKLALAMSLEDSHSATHAATDTMPSGSLSSMGLDRKAMEQERIARLQAKEHISPLPMSNKRTIDRVEVLDATSLTSRNDGINAGAAPSKRAKTDSAGQGKNGRFRRGAVLKTWCYGFDRTDQDIKIEEVLEKNTLQLAVLSSFQWDMEWLLSKMSPTTRMVFVMQAKDQATRDQYRSETASMSNLRLCFPPMPGNVNCMHSKLMLLSYPTHLRVVVPTANLVSYDWGETGVMENSLFLIDLPRRPSGEVVAAEKLPPFGQDLIYFCRAMGLQGDILRSIGKFDFSQTTDLALVHTIGGEHHEAWDRTGYPGLGRAVSGLGLGAANEVEIDFVASSIGAVNEDLVRMIYLACKGDNGTTEYEARTNKPKNKAHATSKIPDIDAITSRFKVYFPTFDAVRQSKGGPRSAGTVCFQERWWESPKFPKKILHECLSVRAGLLMHNKMIFARPTTASMQKLAHAAESGPGLKAFTASSNLVDAKSETGSWTYIGSANFSESAWGRLVQDRTTNKPKLTCRNWECGVILRRPRSEIPAPMQMPAAAINDTGSKPWFFATG